MPPMNKTARSLTDRQKELLGSFAYQDGAWRYQGGDVIPDWATVKQVFTKLGATWKKGKTATSGGFVFADPVKGEQSVAEALGTGSITDPQLAGFFPTPPALAAHVAQLADVRAGMRVLEPSAGQGALLRAVWGALPRAGSMTVLAFELLDANVDVLTREGWPVRGRDFMAAQVPTTDADKVDRVVMNPPFAKGEDVEHVLRAFQWLRPGGKLVAIMSAGVTFKQDKRNKAFREVVARHGGRITALPPKSFEVSGTDVATVLVELVAQ